MLFVFSDVTFAVMTRSDGAPSASCLKVGAGYPKNRTYRQAFHQGRTREFGRESEAHPSQKKKNEIGIVENSISCCLGLTCTPQSS